MKRRFKYDKLRKQNTNQIKNGYKGVMLKHIEYEKPLMTRDVEIFIYEKTYKYLCLWLNNEKHFGHWRRRVPWTQFMQKIIGKSK
jgi:hypothetical protein